MGVYLSKANTEKASECGSNENFAYGVTSMQGWRQSMEDAHIVNMSVPFLGCKNLALYGVFDGHGGSAVSVWIAQNLTRILEECRQKIDFDTFTSSCTDYPKTVMILGEVLIQTFIAVDAQLDSTEGRKEVHEINIEMNKALTMKRMEGDVEDMMYHDSRKLIQNLTKGQLLGKGTSLRVTESNGQKVLTIETDECVDEPNSGCESYQLECSENDALTRENSTNIEELGAPANFNIPEVCGAAAVLAAVITLENDETYIVVANAGDSRAVLCVGGVAVPLTFDHKPTNNNEYSRIVLAGGTVEAGRVDGNLNLSRTLGDLIYKNNTELTPHQQKITGVPDLTIVPVVEDVDFMIVACDGIWDCLTNQEACDFVNEKVHDDYDGQALKTVVETMCDTCVASHPMESNGGIGCDNMTSIVVKFKKPIRRIKGDVTELIHMIEV